MWITSGLVISLGALRGKHIPWRFLVIVWMILQTANLYQERSMLHYVFSEEIEGVLIVSATGNFPAQQTLRVRERELKSDGTKSQCSRWVGWEAHHGRTREFQCQIWRPNRFFLIVWPLSCHCLPHAASCPCSVYQLVPFRLLEWTKIRWFWQYH